jgi:hypothetical protein
MSARRFTKNALRPDLTASNLVYHKLTNRKEHKPTPSQPNNITRYELLETSKPIKKTKKYTRPTKRIVCGSVKKYLVENKITVVVTNMIRKNINALDETRCISQDTDKQLRSNQEPKT